MSPKGRGNKKTPARVMELLQDEVKRTSQAATARATGLTLQTVQRYIKGIGEPTTATLEKLADYFRVLIPWLQGNFENMPYEAAKKHRAAVESGKTSGWVGEEEKQIFLPVHKRVRELMWMTTALVTVSIDFMKGDDEARNEHIEFAKGVFSNISSIMPIVDERDKELLQDRIYELKGLIDLLEQMPSTPPSVPDPPPDE